MNDAPITADPWDKEVDSFDAAAILGITTNHLRQLVFKGKLIPMSREKRRSIFKRQDVMSLKMERMKELQTIESPIGVSQTEHPQDV
jgi:hypothetical protein